ncbi:MAG: translocation/assembly module TamB domain-containing protein [Chryseolinea sp.]
MVEKNKQTILKKFLKIVGWIVTTFLLLLTSIILLIRLPSVQNRITQRAIHFLENKIGTKVQLQNIFISFPKKIVLKGLYLEDQSKDTLLYVGQLSIDTDLWGLTHKSIELNTIDLSDATAFISRGSQDSTFNFDYIIHAFSDSTAADTTGGSLWKFTIEDVNIQDVLISYKDRFSGNDIVSKMGSLKIEMEKFDPTASIYEASSIEWENSDVDILQTTSAESNPGGPEKSDSTSYTLNFDNVDVQKVNVKYVNTFLQQRFDAKIGRLGIDTKQIDIVHRILDIHDIQLHDSFVSYSQYGKDKTEKIINPNSTSIPLSLPSEWNISLDKLDLSGTGFQYFDFSKPVRNNGIDNAHIWLRGIELNAENLMMSKDGIQASIKNLSVNEKNGLAIQSLGSELKLTNTTLHADHFNLKTQSSRLNMDVDASFKSLEQFQQDYENIKFDLTILKSSISLKDVLYFSPTILDSLPIHLPKQTSVALKTKLQGTLNNLNVSQLNLEALIHTSIALHGSVKGLPNIDRTTINVQVEKLYTTRGDIQNILVDSLIPASIQLPQWIQLVGNFNGTIKQPNIYALVKSDVGQLEGNYKTLTTSLRPSYDASITTKQFDIGKVLRQTEMGKLNVQASIKGSGYKMDSLDAAIDVNVKSFEYSHYDYHDFKLNGTIKNYFFTGTAILKDKNLDFELKGDLDYQKEIPHYTFKFNLANADFKELHLSERPLKARATLDIDLATSDLKIINGTMGIRNVAIYNGEALYRVDSLLFASIDQQGKSELSIRSDILTGDFKGTFNVFEMPTILKQHLNQYFELHDSKVNDFSDPQNFTFDLTLKDTDLLTEIIFPELTSFVPGKIQGAFDSEKNTLNLGIEITKIKYAATSVDSFTLNINSDKEAFLYSVKLREFKLDTLRISALRLEGKVANNFIETKLLILDSLMKEKYILGGAIKSVESGFRYSFIQDQILLNYKNWISPADNYLQIGKSGVVAHNFSLSKESEQFSVVTNPKDSTVSFDFLRWQLANLTQLVEGVIPADGELNGSIKLTTAHRGEFNSSLQIKQLSILEKKWGDASFSLSHKSNRYALELDVKGENGKVNVKGFFLPASIASTFDLDIHLSPLDLSLIEPLSLNQLRNVKGFVNGNLKLSGSTKEPSIRGKLTFEEVHFLSTYLNNSFALKNESIVFGEEGIALNNFKLADEKNNEATINGSILTKVYKDFDFDLRITSRNFQLLNTKASDNTLYYGKLNVNATARITGNINQPVINGSLKIGDKSELTYVVPTEEKNALEQKGIVRFIDSRAAVDPFMKNISFQDTTQALFRGMDVDVTIELNDRATLNIVIDPTTGDKLSLKGNSTLVYNSESSGTTNLSGRYEITSGTYNFTFYKLVKREFDIVKGSAITWSGDPLNADMDIRALYKVETSPLDLVYNQINTTNQDQINSYNQRLPFLVYMNIGGKLLVPEITFELDMPDDKRNVFGGAIYSKLQDINTRESDLNKQVFALLILKRFISDNPFESQTSSINNTTRVSVSRLLSEQLNRLSENVKGVQLSFDLKSYETNTGTEVQGQTKLQLGVSKNLFKDRLVVKLAGNVDIEGENTDQKDITEYIGDLALEFKLTPDGRFRITGFRNSNYDMIDGELTETGAGLIYIKDYNSFQELFKSNANSN